MPSTAERLWDQLGEAGSVHDVGLDAALCAPPETFDAPTEPFERVEDERVAELNEKLDARIEEATARDTARDAEGDGASGDDADAAEDNSGSNDTATDATNEASAEDADIEPVTEDRIGFEEFQDLDLRVGRIEAADPIEGSDKLVRLEVDVGVEVRQIVAGIKQLHDVEALPGTTVVIVANLEKAELFGVESNGMVLAAGEDADLLTTHGDAPPGTRVK